jgi:hypothetical protein
MVPDREEFRSPTVATALGWCLVWLMGRTGELGIEEYTS